MKKITAIVTMAAFLMSGCATQPEGKTVHNFSKDFKYCLSKTNKIMQNAGVEINSSSLDIMKNEWTSNCMMEEKGWTIEEMNKMLERKRIMDGDFGFSHDDMQP